MHIYRITSAYDTEHERAIYRGTLADAHHAAKGAYATPTEARIDLLDVDTDKGGIVDILNRQVVYVPVRTWGLTARRGLVELTPND